MSEAREPEEIARKSLPHRLRYEAFCLEHRDVQRKLLNEASDAITSERALVAELVEALKPFAAVLVDIGDDETDADTFQPMSPKNANAPLLTVGGFRRIAAALTRAGAIHE